MARIFFALALFSLALLTTNLILGLRIGDLQSSAKDVVRVRRELETAQARLDAPTEQIEALEAERQRVTAIYSPIRAQVRVHMLCGLAASLVTILVNSITITYFVGTTRWCKEVVDTYGLDTQLTERSRKLKRGAFPWAVTSTLVIVGLVTLGAVSDPSSANFANSHRWVTTHQLAAWIALVIIGYSFLQQVNKIGANYDIIEEILDGVRAVRRERGLDDLTDEELSRFRM